MALGRRSEKVTAKVYPETKRLIERAAEVANQSVSSFVAEAAENAAKSEIFMAEVREGRKTQEAQPRD